MVLPGVQTLFGFQLIAVFSERFEDLRHFEQLLHLGAMALVALAIAMLMTPAAFHRSHGARAVTDTFVHVSSLFLLGSMMPLAAATAIEFYVIGKLVLETHHLATAFGAALFAVLFFFWFVFPRLHTLHARLARAR